MNCGCNRIRSGDDKMNTNETNEWKGVPFVLLLLSLHGTILRWYDSTL